MRKIDIFGKGVFLQGSPLTLLYYRNEFGTDLFRDFNAAMPRNDEDTYDVTLVLQCAWAMARTAEPKTPQFVAWMESFSGDGFTLSGAAHDGGWIPGVIEGAIAELFRERPTEKPESSETE